MGETGGVTQRLADVADQLQNEKDMYAFLLEKTQPMTTKYGELLEEYVTESRKLAADSVRLKMLQMQMEKFEPQIRVVSEVLRQLEEHQRSVREQLCSLTSLVSDTAVKPVSQIPDIAPRTQMTT